MSLFGPPNIEKMEARRNVKGLIKALDYRKCETIRKMEAEALGWFGALRAMEQVINILDGNKERNRDVREAAAKALGELKDPRAVEPLIKILWEGSDVVRKAVANALGLLGETGWKQIVKGDCADFARLGTSTNPHKVELLIKALGSGWSTQASRWAASALGELKDPRSVEPLIEALSIKGYRASCKMTWILLINGKILNNILK